MNITEEIEYKGFDLRISFDYDKGFAGSQLEPPEPEMIEIERVVLLHHETPSYVIWNGLDIEIDITDLLTETQLKEIEEILWNKKEIN